MAYHIVLHREMDLMAQDEQAQEGGGPRHAMGQLAQRLGASILTPHSGLRIRRRDYLGSKLVGSPENWALARELVDRTGSNDTIFCNSEAVGLPIVALSRDRIDRPKLAVFVHNIDRPRGRVALGVLQAAAYVDWFVTCSQSQTDFLRQYLNLPAERATFIWEQTDLTFFSPGPTSPGKRRPIILSVGLERRDYKTLATATADLSVDVKISGFSQDAKSLSQTFPDVMPANMSRQFYTWLDLLQLYRDADVVVVSTFPSQYAAGVQNMIEAMACGCPTIVTRTEGLETYLLDNDGVISIPPGDAVAMRQVIVRLLTHRKDAERLSKQATVIAQARHDSDHYVEILARGLEGLQQPSSLSEYHDSVIL